MRFTGFLGNLQFTADDLRADLVGTDGDTRQIAIAMDETAAASFAQFTRVHLNQSVSFFVCGEPMQSVTVEAPIETGFALSDPIDADIAEEIVDAMNGQGTCP